jgi:hypothetical protein
MITGDAIRIYKNNPEVRNFQKKEKNCLAALLSTV